MVGKRFRNTSIFIFTLLLIVLIALSSASAPKTEDFASDSVTQVIADSVFDSAAPDNVFFLSGWVCPGSGSALLAIVTYNAAGKVIDSAGVEVASSSELALLGFADSVGIANRKPFRHPGYPGDFFDYYRIFARFSLTSGPPIKEIRLLLQNSSNEVASCAVWFDGIKLEKALKAGQKHPTSFHPYKNLLSPEFIEAIEGSSDYYEW
jgi:hypothetical protein